ncbi:MAG: hypothetical protein E6R07_14035 [Nevskiaceae bacterium]|nr:MAG: hypothetical protein E6R07_14035 [Nevskiaceae bacterium]
MKIPVELADQFSVGASLETAFELLADVPRSVSHFPDIAKLQPLGDGAYRWELKPLGAAGIQHQVVYASRYVADAAARTVVWTAVSGVGNGVMQGHWRLRAQGQGTHIDFLNRGELEVPVPMLFRAAAKPVVQGLFQKQVRDYLDNIRRSLAA